MDKSSTYNKFLITVSLLSALVIAIGIILNLQYNAAVSNARSIIEDIQVIPAVEIDSVNYHLNETVLSVLEKREASISSLMELQYSKLQSEYQALSLWAGTLMIVFLVFSLYSIIRVEEIQKQSRAVLQSAEDTSSKAKAEVHKIDDDLKSAKAKIAEVSNTEMEKMKWQFQQASTELMTKTNESFSNLSEKIKKHESEVQSKVKEFDEKYNDYLKKMKEGRSKYEQFSEKLIKLATDFYSEGNKEEGEGGDSHDA